MSVDNYSVAVLGMVNALAEAYGLLPYEFVACVKMTGATAATLTFESPPTDEESLRRFELMLMSLELPPEAPILAGGEAEIYRKIDSALHRAPKSRRRL